MSLPINWEARGLFIGRSGAKEQNGKHELLNAAPANALKQKSTFNCPTLRFQWRSAPPRVAQGESLNETNW